MQVTLQCYLLFSLVLRAQQQTIDLLLELLNMVLQHISLLEFFPQGSLLNHVVFDLCMENLLLTDGNFLPLGERVFQLIILSLSLTESLLGFYKLGLSLS